MQTGLHNSSHDDRLSAIEARLAQIEARLGLIWMPPPSRSEPALEMPPPLPPHLPTATNLASSAQPQSQVGANPTLPPSQPTGFHPDRREAARQWLESQRLQQARQQAARQTKPTDWAKLELRIGQRWASIAGALTFIIGMGLLFAVAWRRGWFQAIPPGMKCIFGSLVGVAMLIAADVVRKRINAMTAIGLNAAGLGVVYLSAYAAFAMFNLISAGVAFGMLTCVAFLGIAIAARSHFASVGVVALIGGYLTPFLVNTENPSPWVMPIHLTVLLSLAVGLTAWRGPAFMAVRSTALVGTITIGSIWAMGSPPVPLLPILLFVAAAWLLFHAETCRAVTTWALDSNIAKASAHTSIFGSVSITVWALTIATLSLQNAARATESLDWTVPMILAVACAVLAFWLVANLRRLFEKPNSTVEKFATVLTCEALALIPIAIALGFSGWLRLAAWGFIAIAAALAARRTRLWPLSLYAIILLTITTIQLICIESWHNDVLSVGTDIQGVYISRWMATAAILAAAWLGVASLTGRPDHFESTENPSISPLLSPPLSPSWRLPLARLAAISGTVLCLALWIHIKTESRSLTFVLPVIASALLFLRSAFPKVWPRLWIDHTVNVCIMFIAGFWVIVYITDDWLRDTSAAFMHPGLLSSLLVAAAALIAAWLTDNPGWSLPPRSKRTIVGWSVAGGVLFISTSFEIARVAKLVFTDETARSSAVSVWWALVAIGLIVLGFKIHRPWPRRVGLGLLGLALAKVVLYDLAALSLEWRTVSFLVLGSVMLAVGLVYGKVSAKMQKAAPQQPSDHTDQSGERINAFASQSEST